MSNRVNNDVPTGEALSRMLAIVPDKCGFRINRAFDTMVSKEWGMSNRVIDDMMLVFVRSGGGAYVIGGEKNPIEAGRVFFASPQIVHSSWPDVADLPEFYSIRFELFRTSSGKAASVPSCPYGFSLRPSDPSRMAAYFERLYFYHTCGGEDGARVCSSLLHLILTECFSALSKESGGRDARIERVAIMLRKNPAARMSVDDMAAEAGLSRKYFIRRFRENVGRTPVDYQIECRCEQARYMLHETSLSVQEIAEELGYPNAYAFSKQFRQRVGHSPTYFRSVG